MKIKQLVVGPLETNCYILYKDKSCLIIDPAAEYKKIKEAIKDYKLEGILITHYHFDHVGALTELIRDYCTDVYNYRTLGIKKTKTFSFEVKATKGHNHDCVTFIFDNDLFVGDFVFKQGIGRTDMPGGDDNAMKDSLEWFKSLEKDYLVYPGHGPTTSVFKEKKENPYLDYI